MMDGVQVRSCARTPSAIDSVSLKSRVFFQEYAEIRIVLLSSFTGPAQSQHKLLSCKVISSQT